MTNPIKDEETPPIESLALTACKMLVEVADGRAPNLHEAYWSAVGLARDAIAQAKRDHFHHALDATAGLVAAAWFDEPFDEELQQ